jgi:hypothetical protein
LAAEVGIFGIVEGEGGGGQGENTGKRNRADRASVKHTHPPVTATLVAWAAA